MGKTKRGAAERSATSAMSRPAPSHMEERKERALKIFSGLQSLEPHDRLVASTAIAGLFEGGTDVELKETAVKITSAGGIAILLARLADVDVRVRCHIAGGMRNMCICGGNEVMERLLVPGVFTVLFETLNNSLAHSGSAESYDPVMTSHHAMVVTEVCTLLNMLAESHEAAIPLFGPDFFALLWGILQTSTTTADTAAHPTIATLVRVRYVAAKLLHTLSEQNAALCDAIQSSSECLSHLVSAISLESSEHNLVKAHTAGVLTNVLLSAVSKPGDIHPETLHIVAALLSYFQGILQWDGVTALQGVLEALNQARSVFMKAGESAAVYTDMERAVNMWKHDKLVAKRRERMVSAGAGATESRIHTTEGAEANTDGEDDRVADVEAEGEDERVADEDVVVDASTPPQILAAMDGIKQYKQLITQCKAARKAYHTARRALFDDAHAVLLSVELLANIADGGEDVGDDEGDDDDDANETQLNAKQRHLLMHLLDSGVFTAAGGLLHRTSSLFRDSAAPKADVLPLLSLPQRVRMSVSYAFCGLSDRLSSALSNCAACLYQLVSSSADISEHATQVASMWTGLVHLTNDFGTLTPTDVTFSVSEACYEAGTDAAACSAIDDAIEAVNANEEEEDEDHNAAATVRIDAALKAPETEARVNRAIDLLCLPNSNKYGDEVIAATALSFLWSEGDAAHGSGAFVLHEAVEVCNALKAAALPGVLSADVAIAKVLRTSGIPPPDITPEWVTMLAQLCNGGFACANDAINRVVRVQSLSLLSTLASPVQGETYLVDAEMHSNIAKLLTDIVSSSDVDFQTRCSVLDGIIDIYSDEVHDDAFAALNVAGCLQTQLNLATQQLQHIRERKKAGDPMCAGIRKADIAHAKEILTNLTNFIEYKRAHAR